MVLYFTILNQNASHTVSYPEKTGFFKEQNAVFRAQIHSVILTKPGFKKGMLLVLLVKQIGQILYF